MTNGRMTVEDWVRAFRAVGVTDEQMHRWHGELERHHPEAHQSFLEWLGMAPERIEEVRRQARAA